MTFGAAIAGSRRFLAALVIGLVGGALVWGVTGRWAIGLLVVVITTAVVTVAWATLLLWPMDAAQTRAHATLADVGDEVGDLAQLLILAGSLAAVGILLASAQDHDRVTYAAFGMTAVLSVWAMLHTLYVTRYARIYYQGSPGGIDFNSDEPPSYVDFYYFSFNLGMTYQVSDTDVTATDIRREVLKHCLFSYVYGTLIVACTINLVINVVG